MTPLTLAREIVSRIPLSAYTRILEPSCGDGSFLSAILDQLTGTGSSRARELIGIEIDPHLAMRAQAVIEGHSASKKMDIQPTVHNADFFREYLAGSYFNNSDERLGLLHGGFDLIVGNPPFGGTFDHSIEDTLDARLGSRQGRKIKKETYAFFIVASLDLLRDGGRLVFVCSDSFLTIPTMTGLRHLLMEHGEVELQGMDGFSEETTYPMLVMDFKKGGRLGQVRRNSEIIDRDAIYATPNLSWGITPEFAGLFSGPLLRDCFVASSGMTTGKNEYFVRELDAFQRIIEPYRFEFFDPPVTLDYELRRARLGRIGPRRRRALMDAEARGERERRVRVIARDQSLVVHLPDPRYRPYNKANGRLVYSDPTHYIVWENDGEAVLTYKRTGNWYLRGVGGQPFFGKEGITWPLVATKFHARYMPHGYILDSGSPCAFLRAGIERDELFFVLGWLLTSLANRVLKVVINGNYIQS